MVELPEDQILEVFQGKVERIEGDVAYVTLVDSKGREADAECPMAELAGNGIREGMRFALQIAQRGSDTISTFVPMARRALSDEEWARLRQDTGGATVTVEQTRRALEEFNRLSPGEQVKRLIASGIINVRGEVLMGEKDRAQPMTESRIEPRTEPSQEVQYLLPDVGESVLEALGGKRLPHPEDGYRLRRSRTAAIVDVLRDERGWYVRGGLCTLETLADLVLEAFAAGETKGYEDGRNRAAAAIARAVEELGLE